MAEYIDQNQALLEIQNIASVCKLAEGEEGVRDVLRHIYRFQPVPIHDLAKAVQIPVPVVASLRRELERRKFAVRKSGVFFTEKGIHLLHSLGIMATGAPAFEVIYTCDDSLDRLVPEIKAIISGRPMPDVTLDQSHATVETIIRRTSYLYERDGMEGKNLMFIGDDDLTSLSACRFADEFGLKLGRVTVVDIDKRILTYIQTTAKNKGWDIETRHADLRDSLPLDLADRFDVFITDPPYTLSGITLFSLRGVESLTPFQGKKGIICFSKRNPKDSQNLYANFNLMGMVPQELLPSFNNYVGAQMHSSSSSLLLCVSAGDSNFDVDLDLSGMYTASRKLKNGMKSYRS